MKTTKRNCIACEKEVSVPANRNEESTPPYPVVEAYCCGDRKECAKEALRIHSHITQLYPNIRRLVTDVVFGIPRTITEKELKQVEAELDAEEDDMNATQN